MISKDMISQIKEKLEKEQAELKEKITSYQKAPELGSDVEDSESTEADEAEETSNALAMAQAYRDRLEEVENAINKINEGTYGKCEKCGKEIPNEKLEKNPTAKFCESCGEE